MEITDDEIDAVWESSNRSVEMKYAENYTDLRNFARAILALEQDAALPVVPEGGLSFAPGAGRHDWPEDFAHENGMYQCRCVHCKTIFLGHKRRPVCKVCAAPSQPGNAPIAAPKWSRLYDAANALTAWLGFEGEISTRNSLAIELESALHAIDGGNPAAPIEQQGKAG